MRIHLLRACAASVALALGLAALPVAAQNNVAFNRRLAVSEQERTPAPIADSAVKPTTAARPVNAPAAVQQPIAQPRVVYVPVAQAPRSQEVMAGDAVSRSTMLQPVPARMVSSAEPAPIPPPAAMPAPVVVSQPAPQYAAAPMGELYPAQQYTQAPNVSAPSVSASRSGTPHAKMVHERHMRFEEPKPMVESPMPQSVTEQSVGGGCGCGDASCDECCDGNGWFSGGRRGAGRWIAGAEFLYARPHFSEPTAYVLHQNPILGPGNVLAAADTYVYHEFDYEPSARAYIAYRLDECCAELRTTYSRLQSDSSKSATTNANASIVPTYFEVQPGPGNTLTSNLDVAGDILDVEFARCIRAGGECIPCDCRTCPDWDLTWSAGARVARWDFNGDVFTNVATDGALDMDQEFIGVGPKIGLEGKRYFGKCQQFQVYSTFDAALLVGWYEYDMARRIPSVGVNPATVESFHSQVTRTIPVTEIELGVKWQPYERLTLSAGWFVQAWWDLGISTQQTSNLLGGLGPTFLLDDSNIMSWDGLTLKAELTF
jgi:hypothetical protein